MEILVRRKGEGKGRWIKVKEQKYENESALQNILYKSPEIIPIEKLGENLLKPRLFIKEAGLPGSGNTDLIGIDEKGGITIIECKLAVNREIRRQVIGQVLEYAAYLWHMSYDQFDNVCRKAEDWADKSLAHVIKEKNGEIEEGWSEEEFRVNVTSTLEKGDFRLIIAVDALNDELRRIIEFLNSRGEPSPQIHALEIRQFETSELQMLIPELFGYATKTAGGGTQRGRWDEKSFIANTRDGCEPEIADIVTRLYEFAKYNADKLSWGTGLYVGSFTFRKLKDGMPISILTVQSDGAIYLNFGEMKVKGVKEEIQQSFQTQVNRIPSVNIPNEAVNVGKYYHINIDTLTEEENMKTFQEAILALCHKI